LQFYGENVPIGYKCTSLFTVDEWWDDKKTARLQSEQRIKYWASMINKKSEIAGRVGDEGEIES